MPSAVGRRSEEEDEVKWTTMVEDEVRKENKRLDSRSI